MRNYLGRIVFVGIVFAAGYFVFSAGNVSGYTFPFIGASQKVAARVGNQAISSVTSAVKKNFAAPAGDLMTAAAQSIDTLAQNALASAKTEVMKALTGAVKKNVDTMAASFGVSTQGSGAPAGSADVSPIQSAIKSGAPAYFTIRNNEQGTIQYTVDWKDGKAETGQVLKGQSQIVSHAWNKVGEYVLQFKIESSGGINEYQIMISIL